MFEISDIGVINFTLSQEENHIPKLMTIKPKNTETPQTINLFYNKILLFAGQLTHITTKDLFNQLEYLMSFPTNYPIQPKEIIFGHPDKPETFLEDTEYLFHFNRQTRIIELSHILQGQKTHSLKGEITSSQICPPANIKAHVHITWIFENEITLDIMPHIGHHLDTYTPLIGFEHTTDIDIKGPFEGGVYIKKVRHSGSFYQRLAERIPIEENMTLQVNYNSHETKELSFHIPHASGSSFLDTSDGMLWEAHIERMIKRVNLLQSRCEILTITLPFLDVTLDDEIIIENKKGKVIKYEITPLYTRIQIAVASSLHDIQKSEISRKIQETEQQLIVNVKNTAPEQEAFMSTPGALIALKDIPKTKIAVRF